MSVFGSGYADLYDLLYESKDYDGEVNRIREIAERYLPGAKRVVDFGCGTGRHARRLVDAGFAVTGVDRSPDMIRQAQASVASLAPDVAPAFSVGDVRTVRLAATFDVALMMFAVLGYQLSNADVLAALTTVRAHLERGGLFMADVWYGPAVLATRPSARTKVVRDGARTITRRAHTVLDPRAQRADVHYTVVVTHPGEDSLEVRETHSMRYFFAEELSRFLEQSGFELLELRNFERDEPVSDDSWNVRIVARAV